MKEGGFGLINALHMTLLKCFLEEIKTSDKSKTADNIVDEEEDHLLVAIKKYIEKPELIWPELIRLVIKSKNTFEI